MYIHVHIQVRSSLYKDIIRVINIFCGGFPRNYPCKPIFHFPQERGWCYIDSKTLDLCVESKEARYGNTVQEATTWECKLSLTMQ